jgi:trigger factor
VLDAVAEKEEIGVSQNELIDYIVTSASQYGMDPNQFAQMLDQSGQVPMIVGEVRRRKALARVLELAVVTDTNGEAVDLSDFVRPAGDAGEAEGELPVEEASSDATESTVAESDAPAEDAADADAESTKA